MKKLSINKGYTGNGSVSANIPSGVKAVFWTAFVTTTSTVTGSYSYNFGVSCSGHKGCWWGNRQSTANYLSNGMRLVCYAKSGISIINR